VHLLLCSVVVRVCVRVCVLVCCFCAFPTLRGVVVVHQQGSFSRRAARRAPPRACAPPAQPALMRVGQEGPWAVRACALAPGAAAPGAGRTAKLRATQKSAHRAQNARAPCAFAAGARGPRAQPKLRMGFSRMVRELCARARRRRERDAPHDAGSCHCRRHVVWRLRAHSHTHTRVSCWRRTEWSCGAGARLRAARLCTEPRAAPPWGVSARWRCQGRQCWACDRYSRHLCVATGASLPAWLRLRA
jgi:hypothetical protein